MEIFIKIITIIKNIYSSEFIQSNAFNFVLVVLLLIYLCKVAKIGEKLTHAQEKIKEKIENSKKAREDSIEFLLDANDTVKNTKNEVLEIESECEKNITLMQQRVEKETVSQVKGIEENTTKIIESENKQTVSALSKKTAMAALELARKHIIETLEKKPEYHQKFIDESIQELDSGIK